MNKIGPLANFEHCFQKNSLKVVKNKMLYVTSNNYCTIIACKTLYEILSSLHKNRARTDHNFWHFFKKLFPNTSSIPVCDLKLDNWHLQGQALLVND